MMVFHVKGCEVHIPEESVPMLKSRARVKGWLPNATLNWNIRALGLVFVATAIQVICLPRVCGYAADGVRESMVIVACNGRTMAASSPAAHERLWRIKAAFPPREVPGDVVASVLSQE